MARSPTGFRLRERRQQLGLTQAAVASGAGISASYLNLIEHGRREVAGALLRRLAAALGVEIGVLSGAEDARLVQDLTELTADPLLQDLQLQPTSAQEIVGRLPGWGRALLRLQRSYQGASMLAESLSDRLSHDAELLQASHELLSRMTSIRSFAEILSEHADLDEPRRRRFTMLLAEESVRLGGAAKALFDHLSDFGVEPRPATPAQEVDDFIIDRGNYFAELEKAAETMRARFPPEGFRHEAVLASFLADAHGVQVVSVEEDDGRPKGRRGFAFEPVERRFIVPAGATSSTTRFQLARLIFRLEQLEAVAALAQDRRLTSGTARERAAEALYSYGAGALLLPYDRFRAAAERSRHDLDRLAALFCVSFEQVCHRLVTLKRPEAEGIPFAFLRVDPAGNISKRFSLPALRLPRQGGACPLWVVYRAFQTPGTIVTQRVRLPDRREFLFVARSSAKPITGFGMPAETYSVMIGCEGLYADRLVYGDGRLGEAATETGINCHLCPRETCPQRAYPPVLTHH